MRSQRRRAPSPSSSAQPTAARSGGIVPGSVGTRVLHGAPCPVAVAPGGYWSGTEAQIRRIGVGYVNTPEGREALGAAVGLAACTGAAVRVLSVDEPVVPTAMMLLAPGPHRARSARARRARREPSWRDRRRRCTGGDLRRDRRRLRRRRARPALPRGRPARLRLSRPRAAGRRDARERVGGRAAQGARPGPRACRAGPATASRRSRLGRRRPHDAAPPPHLHRPCLTPVAPGLGQPSLRARGSSSPAAAWRRSRRCSRCATSSASRCRSSCSLPSATSSTVLRPSPGPFGLGGPGPARPRRPRAAIRAPTSGVRGSRACDPIRRVALLAGGEAAPYDVSGRRRRRRARRRCRGAIRFAGPGQAAEVAACSTRSSAASPPTRLRGPARGGVVVARLRAGDDGRGRPP